MKTAQQLVDSGLTGEAACWTRKEGETMRILDVRRKETKHITRLEERYNKPKFYREMGRRTDHFTTDADIKEFEKQAEKEGAEAIFIYSRAQVAYIPLKKAVQPGTDKLPQTEFGREDDLLQYYKVPPSAF